ncbi:hypothetical protein RvY_05491 [Ramazzottius varieornatus]|uniref:Uncharacterized protein n=1 Tax=Ramazzottius varieornatus TaxID=947166 RepID=A0A1D1UV57_RAMVA|nr:hypothetical protein RvY_05491 [Ramazzottius varieornatus]
MQSIPSSVFLLAIFVFFYAGICGAGDNTGVPLKFFLNVNYIDFKAQVQAQPVPPAVNHLNWNGGLRVEDYLLRELCRTLSVLDSGLTFSPFNNITKAPSTCGVMFQDTIYGRGPVNDEVVSFNTTVIASGTLNAADLKAALVSANLMQTIRVTTKRYKDENGTMVEKDDVFWLLDDTAISDHHTVPLAACIVSITNFVIAVSVTCYYVRALRKSERYRQVPILNEEDEEMT